MNIKVIVESLKFYKLKSSSAVKGFFIILIAVRAFMTMAPVGDRDFAFISDLMDPARIQNLNFSLPTKGNLIVIGIYFAGYLLALWIGLVYAEIFILENEKYRSDKVQIRSDSIFMIPLKSGKIPADSSKDSVAQFVQANFKPASFKRHLKSDEHQRKPYLKTALLDLLKNFLKLILFALLLLVIFSFSTPLFGLPFIIISLMLSFTPLNMLYAQNTFGRSLELSFRQTKGAKLTMFFTYMMQALFFNLISDILMLVLENYYYSYLMLEAFLFAFEILALARLYALFYQILALRQPYRI